MQTVRVIERSSVSVYFTSLKQESTNMPLEEIGGGCLEVILRFVCEVMGEGSLRFVWAVCQYTGASMVWVCTFGRVWPLDEYEHLAGTAGLLAYVLLIWWLVETF